jgi:hypothetical protein
MSAPPLLLTKPKFFQKAAAPDKGAAAFSCGRCSIAASPLAKRESFPKLRGMDTIKILLGVTMALLLGAFAMSWKNFRQDQRDTPRAEAAAIQRQIAEIKLEREQLRLERERIMLGDATEQTHATPPAAESSTPEISLADEMPEEPITPPVAPLPEIAKGDEQRTVAIKNAAIVAKISEWVESKEIGSFATLEVIDAISVKAGTVLCVRRDSGILGKIKVSEITADGTIANTLSQFDAAKPVAGDELILELLAE